MTYNLKDNRSDSAKVMQVWEYSAPGINLVMCNSRAMTWKLLDTLVTLQTKSEGWEGPKCRLLSVFILALSGGVCNPAVNKYFDAR